MTIHVTNGTSQIIQVAINQWGNDGDTSFFSINPGISESWDRTDKKGFVMAIEKAGSPVSYFVKWDSAIVVSDHEVKDHGDDIHPLAQIVSE